MLPANEPERLQATRRYQVLDTPPDGSFDRIVSLAAQLFDVPIALVTIVDEERIWFKARHGLGDVSEIPREPGLCASAICDDEPYIIERARTDPRSLMNSLVTGDFGLQFYAAAQLKTRSGHNLGTLCLLDRKPRLFGAEDRELLNGLAGVVMDELELRLAAIETVAKERAVASTLQEAMLPAALPKTADVVLDALYSPASSEAVVGGDWYDALVLEDHRILLSIGDVTGHGIDAATLMGKMRQSLRTIALITAEPAAILHQLDRVLRNEDSERIVTAFVAVVDLKNRSLEYASAGHPPPLLRAPDGSLTALDLTGAPLGLRTESEPCGNIAHVAPQSVLVLYTDGIIEYGRDLIAGETALRATVARADIAFHESPANAIKATLAPGSTVDDIAILTARFT